MYLLQEKEISEEDKKIYMTEKRIKEKFIQKQIPKFAQLIDVNPEMLRLYCFEFPVRTNSDGTKYADIVLELMENDVWSYNKLFVLEFKSKKVDYQSAVSQVLRYSDIIQKQLYRKKRVTPFILAPGYSEHELSMAKKHKVIPVQYDHKSGYMKIVFKK